MTNQSYNCTIRLVPLAYCTIDNICILSVTYKAHKRVVETRGYSIVSKAGEEVFKGKFKNGRRLEN